MTLENIGLFWDIDLKKNTDLTPIKMFPKKNHSMIYIKGKVYIVGGDEVITLYYSEEGKEIIPWASLNYKRFEPSLIKHGNYLLCFDTSKKFLNNRHDERRSTKIKNKTKTRLTINNIPLFEKKFKSKEKKTKTKINLNSPNLFTIQTLKKTN